MLNLNNLAELAVVRGAVLHGVFENIDHKKFFVIIGENNEQLIGFFFINSNIHQSLKNKPAQFEMQMSIKKSNYDFLNYDSFVCADKIKIISKSRIVSDIVNKKTEIKGSLTENDLEMLLNATRNSKLFSKIEKDTFFK